jgi:ribosomal protein S18 acetylase RimI-like enzyme
MRTASWRDAAPQELAAAFAIETRRWQDVLAWDTSATWPRLEAARLEGRALGAVTRAADATLSGWAYWGARGDEMHCGAVVASTAAETAALVAALVADADRAGAGRTVVFAFSDAPALAEVLGAHGFVVQHYEFMAGAVAAAAAAPVEAAARSRDPGDLCPWDLRDLAATADLLGACYPAGDWTRPFAPSGAAEAWREYVRDLVLAGGCGRFRPTLSRLAARGGGSADGVALVTDLGHGSAHLAQLAVRPSAARRGLGRALVTAVRHAGAAAGFARMTLLVNGTNEPARRLYHQLGFEPRARFVAATRLGAVLGADPLAAGARPAADARPWGSSASSQNGV